MLRVVIREILRMFRLYYQKAQWRKKNRHNHTNIISITNLKKITVGKGTYGNLYVKTFGNPEEQLDIGNYCSIANDVKFILGGEHDYSCISTFPFDAYYGKNERKAISKGKIVIEDDVWIGTSAIILSGVTIGRGAIVGAGSLVTNDIPEYSIVGGVPAKVIKYRFEADIINMLKKIEYKNISDETIRDNMDLLQNDATMDNIAKLLEKINM